MGKIKITRASIDGLYIIEPTVYSDSRGYFMETYSQSDFQKYGLNISFVQDNQSFSVKGVLRGMHLQKTHPQGKLVRVIEGSVFDVAVDMRKDSPTFGKWFGIELSDENKKQLYIPEGFAHGFYVMSDEAKLFFKVTNYYYPNDEIGFMWNDPSIAIQWPIPIGQKLILSEKDKKNYSFYEISNIILE